LPVISESKEILGLITQRNITNLLANFKITLDSAISKAIQKEFKKLSVDDSVKYLSKAFNRHQYVLVEGDGQLFICENKHLLENILA
jgi:predicted transcriptional regulator